MNTSCISTFPNQPELFKTAQKWVGQTFFGAILKQMHNSPFKSELWSGGRGGQTSSTLFDQHLAERMARSSGRPLAESIVKQLQRVVGRHRIERTISSVEQQLQ